MHFCIIHFEFLLKNSRCIFREGRTEIPALKGPLPTFPYVYAFDYIHSRAIHAWKRRKGTLTRPRLCTKCCTIVLQKRRKGSHSNASHSPSPPLFPIRLKRDIVGTNERGEENPTEKRRSQTRKQFFQTFYFPQFFGGTAGKWKKNPASSGLSGQRRRRRSESKVT